MTRTKRILLRVTAAAFIAASAVANLPAETSPHQYFDSLVGRSDHWRSYSLRTPGQLARPRDGGYASSNSDPLTVSYDPSSDNDSHAQDAAKVVIPPFSPQSSTKLTTGITAAQLTLNLSDLGGDVTKVTTALNAKGDQIKIGSEIMITNMASTPLDRATGIVTLSQRGAYGTKPVAHSAGELVHLSGNSLGNQIRVPFESFDGATWFITWDGYFTDSWLNTGIGNYKAFQLSSDNSIWLEPQTNFDGEAPGFDPARHVAGTGRLRSYNNLGGPAQWSSSTGNQTGPGVTDNNPLSPTVKPFFLLHPNRWTRWWIRIEQRANDYDYVDLWMADEVTGPVQIYSRLPVSVRNGKIDKFYVEFNTSTAQLQPGRLTDLRDLVAYVRNVAILKDPPQDVTGFLQRPGATGSLPAAGPSAPRNVRIISSLYQMLLGGPPRS